mmetsp:Transcript_15999/g.44277  ORF Transcript_15999/g.44277 Transcript_15999/m.44277 type:complete len:122 (+) Transcript_15999:2213-2578(+)
MHRLIVSGLPIVNIQNNIGDAPLHHAASKGDATMTRGFLKSKGMDTTIQNRDGDTAWHKACTESQLKVLRVLEASTKQKKVATAMGIRNRSGKAAMEITKTQGRHDIIELRDGVCSKTSIK